EGAASAYREGLAAVDELVRLVHDNLPAFGGAGGARLAVVSTHGLALGERGETLHGLFASDAVTLAPALLPAERAAAADAGVPTFSMTRVAGELLRVATGSTADESGDEGVDLFVARLPRRLYGWPVEAVAVSEAGWLRAGPDPEWHPAGNAAAGPAGAEAAPDAVRARVEEAGITPTSEGLQREEVAALLAPLRRGHALAAAGDVENALGAFREAAGAAVEAIQPRREIVRALMRQPNGPERREALDSTLAEIESLAGSDASRRLELANACLDAKDSSRALAAVRGLADEDLDPGLELSLAEILASAGATEQAVAKIESVASAESEAPELWEWSGDLLLQSGNHYRAREAYEAALASPRGRSPELVLKLGDALKMLGEKDQALIRYAEALRLDPTYRLPHVSAAEILIEKGETERAAHALALSVGSTGDSAADALRRAAVMERHGLLAAASGELEEARAENPENPRLRSVLAAIYAKGGQEEAARQLLDSLRGGGPYDAAVWIEVARADALIGDEEGALAALSEAARTAVPGVAEEVRADPILRLFGDESRLAAAARGFSSGTAP
ncbi:MAG: tetratricopeptide repeat protein, partial [Acidobacteriota bacterium]|nr:tetratricopeptide repeat protein [Acidobacteriota bacterium]